MGKTIEEINALKQQWEDDPCWEIETTEGFEEHAEELRLFSETVRKKWSNEYNEKLRKQADILGCPGNVLLAEYVLNLENMIDNLLQEIERRFGNIERKIDI